MTPDPKWLEILKASGWQTTALATAFGVMLLVIHLGWVTPPVLWFTAFCVLAFLICLCLALASIGHAITDFLQPRIWLAHWSHERQQQKAAGEYIPFMTDVEKQIIAYLLHHNQKTFTAPLDGGHAATLISRGIVFQITARGQAVHPEDVPHTIPDHVWNVLAEHKDKFPYAPQPEGDIEPHPWRVHWMLR